MTDRELMQQALEALELEDMACRYEKDTTPAHIANAITALRERLAQPEQEPDMTNFKPLIERLRDLENNMGSAIYEDAQTCGEAANVIEKLLGRLAQPVQEPVAPKCGAIIEVFGKDWRLEYLSLPIGKHKLYTQQYNYTAPQQRQWQGLTPSDWRRIDYLHDWTTPEGRRAAASEIEDVLREKNA